MYPCTGLDRPLGFQEVGAPRISRQSAQECGKVVSLTHLPPLPRGDIPDTSVTGWVDPRATVWTEELPMKNPNKPIGDRTRDIPDCNVVLYKIYIFYYVLAHSAA